MKIKSNPVNARVTYFPPESEALRLSVEQPILDGSREIINTLEAAGAWDPED